MIMKASMFKICSEGQRTGGTGGLVGGTGEMQRQRAIELALLREISPPVPPRPSADCMRPVPHMKDSPLYPKFTSLNVSLIQVDTQN